ncbi:MAG: hypothetical protein DBX48_06355 [Limosilactobacillus fermentum]|jgi:hypothetical protein|nr:MAG: hypothetical protein DBX48_06355 [Limosilactobacillus fermentum]
MTLILVMLKVLVFALCVGAIVSVIVCVPLALYGIPYCLWVGRQNTMGKHLDKKKESVFRTAKNATKFYKAWITRQEPIF